MAAELHPPGEAPIITPISADSAATVSASADTTAVPTSSAAAPTTTSDLLLPTLSDHNTCPPPTAPKRQRRPSVRLGEIGDQPVTLSYDAHHQHHPHPRIRRAPPQSWRPNKELASSKSVKARSLTNLVIGNDGREAQEVETNQNGDVGFEFGQRRKAKRGTTKRLRSSWVSKVEDVGVGGEEKLIRQDKEEEEQEGFREFNPDSDSQLKVQESPLRSFDVNYAFAIDTWGRRGGSESGAGRGGEGVRSWLIDLGLSRYSPVFEVHEVDDEVLPFLTLEDLKDMGINAVGSRRKLYSAIQKLRQGFARVALDADAESLLPCAAETVHSVVRAYESLIQDHNSDWILGFMGRMGFCTAPAAELWVIVKGFELAWSRGYRQIILEVDFDLAKNWIETGVDKYHPMRG